MPRDAKLSRNMLIQNGLFHSYFVVVSDLFRDFCIIVSQRLISLQASVKGGDYVMYTSRSNPEKFRNPFGVHIC